MFHNYFGVIMYCMHLRQVDANEWSCALAENDQTQTIRLYIAKEFTSMSNARCPFKMESKWTG